MTSDERACEFEAMITEVQAIAVEVQGMRWDNEQRIIAGDSVAFSGDDFFAKADAMRTLVDKFRALKKKINQPAGRNRWNEV